MATDDLVGPVPFDALSARTPRHDPPIDVEEEDRVVSRALQEHAESLFVDPVGVCVPPIHVLGKRPHAKHGVWHRRLSDNASEADIDAYCRAVAPLALVL